MFRKTLTVLAVLLLSCAFAFANGQDEKSGENAKMEISWVTWISEPVNESTFVEEVMEKAFPDVDLKLIAFERNTFTDQLNTRAAGGDIPDIIYRYGSGDTRDYVKQGILTEVPIELVKKNAPDMFQDAVEFGTAVWMSTYIDGKNYGIPFVQPKQTFPFTGGWRMDYLEAVGITKLPETIEEMEEAFTRLTFDDPDDNGRDDTYGATMRGKDWPDGMFMSLYGAYGVFPFAKMITDQGGIVPGYAHPNFKLIVKTLSRWYEAGIIDPEFMTTDWALLKEKWYNGRIGYVPSSTWYRYYEGTELYDGLKEVDPTAEISMGPAVKGPQGLYGYPGWGKATSNTCFGIHLSEDMHKLEKAMHVVNETMSDSELYTLTHWGEEGVHWERNPENGGPRFLGTYADAQKRGPLGTGFFYSMPGTWENQKNFERDDFDELTKYAVDRNVEPEKQYTYLISMGDEDIRKLELDMGPKWKDWYIRFIIGDADVDSQWDEYMAELNAAGLGEIITAYSDAYGEVGDTLADIESQF